MRTRIWHSDWKPRWLIRCVSAALLSFMDKQEWQITIDLDHDLPFAKHEAGFAGKIHGVIFLFQLWTLKNLAKTSSGSVPAPRICDTGAPA